MKRIQYTLIGLITIGLCIGCGGSDNSDDPTPPDPVSPPSATSLVFPDNNTECNEGTIVSETESEVTFKWDTAENADSYTVNLKNLNSGNEQSISSQNTELPITIKRGVAYAWSVTSKASGTDETAESTTWKFYNAGLAVENHPPFPAEALFPKTGSAVDAGTIDLSWAASDVDDDISSFSIYLDENSTPTTLIDTTTEPLLTFAAVSGKVYYWQITILDDAGNKTSSEIFQFKTN